MLIWEMPIDVAVQCFSPFIMILMNFMSWNVRRAGSHVFPSPIRDIVNRHNISLLLLMETRCSRSKADQIV